VAKEAGVVGMVKEALV